METKVLKADDLGAIEHALEAISRGELVAFPTDTVYGVGCDPWNAEAILALYEAKRRPTSMPIPVLLASAEAAHAVARTLPLGYDALAEAFWPGGLTILFTAAPAVSKKLTAGTGKIGIRFSSDPIADLLARRLGRPITATSANRSGGDECRSAQEVLAVLGDRLDAVIDGGTTPGPPGSTIVDVTIDPPLVVREGVISKSRLGAVLRGT